MTDGAGQGWSGGIDDLVDHLDNRGGIDPSAQFAWRVVRIGGVAEHRRVNDSLRLCAHVRLVTPQHPVERHPAILPSFCFDLAFRATDCTVALGTPSALATSP